MAITADRLEIAGGTDLLTRARAGEASAFCQLAAEHERRLLQQAFGLTRDLSAAEDLVSETLVEAWRSLSRYNDACRFSNWLFSILLHRHQKALRRAFALTSRRGGIRPGSGRGGLAGHPARSALG
jgi:RNA polymerase sigma-70 factor, ECF subfamily